MPKKVKEPAKKTAAPKKKSTTTKKTSPAKKQAKKVISAAAKTAPKTKTTKTILKTAKTVSRTKRSKSIFSPIPTIRVIPAEIVALFDAFDLDNEKFNINNINAAVKNISLKELNNLIKSIDLNSEEGLILQKKLEKNYNFKDSDLTIFKDGKFKNNTLLLKCLCDKNLYKEWLLCFRKVCCCCCNCCNSWPIIHPVHPFCKYCCRCRLIRIQKNGAGTFYANTLDFIGAGVTVTQSPLHEANITIAGGGGGVTLPLQWNQVDKTGSSIADLATRKHSDLSGIGTNTHEQIDTHISKDNNVHGAAGNIVGTNNVQTLSNKTLTDPQINGTLTGNALQNDSAFAAAAANKLASSSSIKSYVDNSVAAVIDDTAAASDSTWSSGLISDKMKVIRGDYYGDPPLSTGGTSPFKFNIDTLAVTINPAKVFIIASGFKTNSSGNLLTPLQITWNVSFNGTNNIVTLTLSDDTGVVYDPGVPEWSNRKIKVKFIAFYAENIATVNTLMP